MQGSGSLDEGDTDVTDTAGGERGKSHTTALPDTESAESIRQENTEMQKKVNEQFIVPVTTTTVLLITPSPQSSKHPLSWDVLMLSLRTQVCLQISTGRNQKWGVARERQRDK